MKLKNILLVVIIAFVLAACAPAVQGFVQLPADQETALTGIFIAVVALAFDFIIAQVPWLAFLKQYQEALSLSLAALLVKALENLLPTGSDGISIPAVGLLISVALYLLGRTALMKNGVKAFAK